MSYACTDCDWTDPSDPPSDRCPNCDGPMEAVVADSVELGQ